MENHHVYSFFNGKIHYFDWAIFNSYVKLPEGSWLYHEIIPFMIVKGHNCALVG